MNELCQEVDKEHCRHEIMGQDYDGGRYKHR